MGRMRTLVGCAALLCALAPAQAQIPSPDDPITVSTDHPRILLRPARLRLLRRERERKSIRWQQFELFLAGHAAMPEPGFANALYYQVAGDSGDGRAAIAWALGENADLRQQALVYDWCQDLLSAPQKHELEARLQRGIAATASNDAMAAVDARALAAVALYDHVPQLPAQELARIVHGWWMGRTVPALAAGRAAIARDDAYPLYELLHVLRDNTTLDLRDSAVRFFHQFPTEHLVSYYPAPLQAPENDFYIGAVRRTGEPDLRAAALSRAAELAMVAYDPNAADTQLLQGWLMHDRYLLRGAFGIPYELLWANPYQPGLSYDHAPKVWHNAGFGRLFIRSEWDDEAEWFGDFDGVMQVFRNGQVTALDPARPPPTLLLHTAAVCFGRTARRFRVTVDEGGTVFIVNLQPRRTYQVEVDDQELYEADTDPSGILEVEVPAGREVGLRISESGVQ
ncbi:MAG TPA: hypothetical protein VHW09_05705 [Bryobacteraceae bacterium]|nr:hypothetical protein [Bryobacteraceae bacterium]